MAEVSRTVADTAADVIATETGEKANTAARVGQMFIDIIASTLWKNSGIAAGRPASSTVVFDTYFATDTKVLSIWDGTAWIEFAAGASFSTLAELNAIVTDATLGDLTASEPANVTKAAAAVGVAVTVARADHKHDISTAAPGATGLGTSSGEGSATTLARSDHTHQSNTAPVAVTKAAAAIGTSGEPARADHKHDVSTAAPAATGVATSSGEGSATTLARSDHTHQANTAPVNVTKAAAAIGTSGQPARADHKHDVTTAAAVELTDSTNAEGNATSLARSNHTHAHGNRGGGSLHAAVVSNGNAGFMIGADKLKLDKFTAEYSGTDATRMRVDGLYSQTEIADSFSVEVDTADSPAASSLLRNSAGAAVALTAGFAYSFEVKVQIHDASVYERGTYLVEAQRPTGGDVELVEVLSSGAATTSGLDMQFAEDTVNQYITCQPTVGGKAGDRKVRWSVRVERRPIVTEDA